MMQATSFMVETNGIKLPDGTIWGAEKSEMLRVVYTSEHGGMYEVYDVVGGKLIRTSNGLYTSRQMRKIVADFINYQLGIGNRVYQSELGEILADDGCNRVYADHPGLR